MRELCHFLGKNLPDRCKCKVPGTSTFLVGTLAFPVGEVRSHRRALSRGTVFGLYLIITLATAMPVLPLRTWTLLI